MYHLTIVFSLFPQLLTEKTEWACTLPFCTTEHGRFYVRLVCCFFSALMRTIMFLQAVGFVNFHAAVEISLEMDSVRQSALWSQVCHIKLMYQDFGWSRSKIFEMMRHTCKECLPIMHLLSLKRWRYRIMSSDTSVPSVEPLLCWRSVFGQEAQIELTLQNLIYNLMLLCKHKHTQKQAHFIKLFELKVMALLVHNLQQSPTSMICLYNISLQQYWNTVATIATIIAQYFHKFIYQKLNPCANILIGPQAQGQHQVSTADVAARSRYDNKFTLAMCCNLPRCRRLVRFCIVGLFEKQAL